MGLYDLVSGNSTNSPEKKGEFLRLPESALGFAEMFSRFSTVSRALYVMGRVSEVHPDVEESAIAEGQKAYEPVFTTDSVRDTAGGMVGNSPINTSPASQSLPVDHEAIARQRIDQIFASRGQ